MPCSNCILTYRRNPDRVRYNLTFEGELNPQQLETDFNRIMYQDLPKIRYDQWLGVPLGDLLIYYQNFTDLTRVPLKFRTLNLTWSNELNNENSPRYRLHAERFCKDVSGIFLGYFTVHVPSLCLAVIYISTWCSLIKNFTQGTYNLMNCAILWYPSTNETGGEGCILESSDCRVVRWAVKCCVSNSCHNLQVIKIKLAKHVPYEE